MNESSKETPKQKTIKNNKNKKMEQSTHSEKTMQQQLNECTTPQECTEVIEYLMKCSVEFLKKAEYLQNLLAKETVTTEDSI